MDTCKGLDLNIRLVWILFFFLYICVYDLTSEIGFVGILFYVEFFCGNSSFLLSIALFYPFKSITRFPLEMSQATYFIGLYLLCTYSIAQKKPLDNWQFAKSYQLFFVKMAENSQFAHIPLYKHAVLW